MQHASGAMSNGFDSAFRKIESGFRNLARRCRGLELKMLSSPKVMVLYNKTATLQIGDQVPSPLVAIERLSGSTSKPFDPLSVSAVSNKRYCHEICALQAGSSSLGTNCPLQLVFAGTKNQGVTPFLEMNIIVEGHRCPMTKMLVPDVLVPTIANR